MVRDNFGVLWGTTIRGGASNAGTVFRISPSSGATSTVVEFTGNGGARPGYGPYGGLIKASTGLLWGTTNYGGISDNGTVYKINPATNAFTSVLVFTGFSGALPGHCGGELWQDGNDICGASTSEGKRFSKTAAS